MKRSYIISSALLATNLLGIFDVRAQHDHVKKDDRPNILFIIADDASFPHFSANGSVWVKTPGFDRVASEGILFRNCYTPNAKSAPSRSSILTGLYSWQSGAAANHSPVFPTDLVVFTEVIASNGYELAFTGKGWGPGDEGKVDGKPRLLTGKPFQKNKLKPPTNAISSNDYLENFRDFLNQQNETQPWFFWFGCFEPHRSYKLGSGEKLGGKSTAMIDSVPAYWPDNELVRTDMLDYAYEIEYFDRQIELYVDELEKRGLLNNTVVIVTSDNGMPFPRSKGNNYEISNHMPLAVMWKNGIVNPGRTVDDYVNFVDFAPTMLELTRSDYRKFNMHEPAGKSLLNIFKSKKGGLIEKDRDHVVLGRERHDNGRPGNQSYPIRAIIKDDLLYIYNMKPHLWPAGNPETGYLDADGSPTKTSILQMDRDGDNIWYYNMSFNLRPEEELYDLSVDKDCINNLASHPVYIKRKQDLRKHLLKTLRKQQDPRMFGNGDVFDVYPTSKQSNWNLYERIINGDIKEPWEQTKWVSPSDYEMKR